MNILQATARKIISSSFHFSVWTIEQFHDTAVYEQKTNQLQELPQGTLGKDIASCLKKNGLRLVPAFESHDMKHVLLQYKMTAVDEIRLQAFMLGNGNTTFPSMAIFLFGVLLLPDCWPAFYRDFMNGKNAKPISTWTIDQYAHCQTSRLRETIFNFTRPPQKSSALKTLTKYGAYAAIIAGIAGMLFCLPFLFSSSIVDLAGAGFPFLAGAIIAGAGLIALSNLAAARTTGNAATACEVAHHGHL